MKVTPWILCSCLSYLFSLIKRTFFRFRRRRSSDPSLPTTNPGLNSTSSHNGASNNYINTPHAAEPETELAWDDWGDGAPMSIKIEPSNPSVGGNQSSQGHGDQSEMNEDVDFFADMTPSYRKAATIRKKTHQHVPTGPTSLTQGLSNRLTMGVDETAVLTDELGTWTDDGNTWEEEAVDDLEWEADRVIREKKLAEREKRAAEQRRKRMEKEAQRAAKKDTSKLATKLK